MGLSYSATVVIIIVGAAASAVIGFAIWRLCFFNPRDDPDLVFQMSDEQKGYIRDVRDRNRQALMMETGTRI